MHRKSLAPTTSRARPSLEIAQQGQITDLVQRNRTLEHTVKKLTEQVHAEQRRADDLVAAEREAKRLAIEDVKGKWRVEYDRWRAASADLHVCHNIVQLMTRDEMLEAEGDIIKARQATEREIARRVGIETNLIMLKGEKLSVEVRVAELEDELNEARANYEEAAAAQKAEIDKLGARLADGRANASDAERERDELEDKLAELRAQYATAQAAHESCASKLERSALQIESLQTKVADVERAAEELRRTNTDLQRQVDKWQSFETRGSEESATLRREKVQLEISVRELESRVEKKEEVVAKLKQRSRENKDVIEQWQTYVAERDSDVKRLEAESVELKRVIAKLQKKLDTANERWEQKLAEGPAPELEERDEQPKPKKAAKARSKSKQATKPSHDENDLDQEHETPNAGPSRAPSADEDMEVADESKARRKRQRTTSADTKSKNKGKARAMADDDDPVDEPVTQEPADEDEAEVAQEVADPEPDEGPNDNDPPPRKTKRKRPTPEEVGQSDEAPKPSKRRTASVAPDAEADAGPQRRAGSRKPPESFARAKKPPSSRKTARAESATQQSNGSRALDSVPEEGSGDAAPAKKMKKINIFPTQPAPMFDFSAKPQVPTGGLDIPSVLSPIKADDRVPARSTSGIMSSLGTFGSLFGSRR